MTRDGGALVSAVLVEQGVRFLFTLCGGHISPILVGAKRSGIRVIDVRHEANAVFAADAVARLTGVPGVAAVTAGPGATNTLTAVKNAQLAQSPVVLLGGATATVLKGRGSLQDIDQMALFRPHVKWAATVKRVRDLAPKLRQAFRIAAEGVPGPVFLECPVDLLFGEPVVREWYGLKSGGGADLASKVLDRYLRWHLGRVFRGADAPAVGDGTEVGPVLVPEPAARSVDRALALLRQAQRPVLLVGSQAMLDVPAVTELAAAVTSLGLPVYLSGMARGLLGHQHPLQARHQRRRTLRAADLVLLAGVPCDFRLDYGRHIGPGTVLISANRSRRDLRRNRRPKLGVLGDPSVFLRRLAAVAGDRAAADESWLTAVRDRDRERQEEIGERAARPTERVNPLALCAAVDRDLPDDSTLVADGGDFVATASYIVSPRGPLRWLDPGVFGTLGVGAGFALGAKLCRPDSEVWIFYGDGSAAYSLAEFDTFVRHRVAVIALVGNDASWAQIARDQIEILGDDVATVLRRTDYHRVAEGFGARGLELTATADADAVVKRAREIAAAGDPVLINAHLEGSDFRQGSLSI